MRFGYTYLSLKKGTWDTQTNIFPEIFTQSLQRINPTLPANDITRLLVDITLKLGNNDLGKVFFERL